MFFFEIVLLLAASLPAVFLVSLLFLIFRSEKERKDRIRKEKLWVANR
jgi:hypothetical protein